MSDEEYYKSTVRRIDGALLHLAGEARKINKHDLANTLDLVRKRNICNLNLPAQYAMIGVFETYLSVVNRDFTKPTAEILAKENNFLNSDFPEN